MSSELSTADRLIAARAGTLFGGLIMEYEIYRGCEDSERDEMRDVFAARLRQMHPADKETVIVFMLDILSKIGPDKLVLLLEQHTSAQEAEQK